MSNPIVQAAADLQDFCASEGWRFCDRVVLIAASNGVPVDISLGAMPFEERTVARATDFAITPSVTIRTCSAEDLVVMKAFAGRDRDWLDIAGIVDRQGRNLDRELILPEVLPLFELKEDPDSGDRLRALLAP